jgi:N-acetylmuramoyl-L-alanine amidase
MRARPQTTGPPPHEAGDHPIGHSPSGRHRRSQRARVRLRRTVVISLVIGIGLILLVVTSVARPMVPRTRRRLASTGTSLDRSYFAPGACVRFPPLAGNRHLTVFLDAGHGGIDPGAIGETESGASIDEAVLTLPMELDTMALLRADGFTVVVSRTRATTVVRLNSVNESDGVLTLQGAHNDVEARDICANMAKANVLVGIYLDYGASTQNAGSITAYDTSRSFSAANLRLATLIQGFTLLAMNAKGWGIPLGGTMPDSQLGSSVPTDSTGGLASLAANYDHLLLLGPYEAGYQTTPSTMPGAVIEPLFITDPFEGSLADTVAGQQTIARGIAVGIERYFTQSKPSRAGHHADKTSG